MGFSDYLEKIYKGVSGAVACGVVGFDGLTVETYPREKDGLDIESINAELSTKFRDLFGSFAQAGLGEPEELVVRSNESVILLRSLNQDYCLMLALNSQAGIGKGRYYLRILGPMLAQEL